MRVALHTLCCGYLYCDKSCFRSSATPGIMGAPSPATANLWSADFRWSVIVFFLKLKWKIYQSCRSVLLAKVTDPPCVYQESSLLFTIYITQNLTFSKVSDSNPYSGVTLRPWTFQWYLTLHLLIWTVSHINRSLHQWSHNEENQRNKKQSNTKRPPSGMCHLALLWYKSVCIKIVPASCQYLY